MYLYLSYPVLFRVDGMDYGTYGTCMILILYWYTVPTSRKLATQTSVMNGTLDVENMDVERVCDAGGILDHDGPTPSLTRFVENRTTSCA